MIKREYEMKSVAKSIDPDYVPWMRSAPLIDENQHWHIKFGKWDVPGKTRDVIVYDLEQQKRREKNDN